jgi:poly-gamma-glutamate capsule biosynthesis protein CapA/YwtB (metallophosphatase superfamily)
LYSDMTRREFFVRLSLLVAGLALPRRLRAQQARSDSTATAPSDSTRLTPAGGERTLSLAVGGDVTPGANLETHVDQQLAAGVPAEQLWPLYFAGVRPVLEAADVALVNLECPFTTRGRKLKKNFNFRARPELVKILQAGSVDVVTLANNHLMDYGREGVEDTLVTLEAAGIEHFGAGSDLAAARAPAILVRNGIRLGLVGYYFQAPPDMLEPKSVYATGHRPGVAGVFKDLRRMRAQLEEDLTRLVPAVDVAIPYFHWGHEGSTEVRDYQIELAHRAIDLGGKAVLGAHPHRLQGVELYRGAPIFYSLGNFVFGGNKDPKDKLSAIARLRMTAAGVVDSELVPIQITRWPEAPFQPFPLAGDEREAVLAQIGQLSAAFPATITPLVPYASRPRREFAAPDSGQVAPVDSAGVRPR